MGLFSKSDHVIGLDIGSSAVKLLELTREKKETTWRLSNFGMVKLPPEAIVDGAVMNTNVVVDAIRELVARHKIKTKEVCTSVSGHSVIIKRINLPVMTPEELEESIHWEAEQYIPFDIQDVNIDLQILDSEGDEAGQMEVLLVAARKELVNEYVSLIQEAGLNPSIIDVDAFAVDAAYARHAACPAPGIGSTRRGIIVDRDAWRDPTSAMTFLAPEARAATLHARAFRSARDVAMSPAGVAPTPAAAARCASAPSALLIGAAIE